MEWYKNKKAINSRALKNTCCICITFAPAAFFSPKRPLSRHTQFHSLPIYSAKKAEAAPANNFRNSMGEASMHRRHHPSPHFYCTLFFLEKSSFLQLPGNILCCPIIVIIKVKYSSNLGWYSRSFLWTRSSSVRRLCSFFSQKAAHNISRILLQFLFLLFPFSNILRWDKLRQFRCSLFYFYGSLRSKFKASTESSITFCLCAKTGFVFIFCSIPKRVFGEKTTKCFRCVRRPFFATGNLITLIVQ